VELPSFEGANPSGWLARAEKFFEVQSVSSRESCSWLSSAWRAMPIRGSLFGDRTPRTILGKNSPWH